MLKIEEKISGIASCRPERREGGATFHIGIGGSILGSAGVVALSLIRRADRWRAAGLS